MKHIFIAVLSLFSIFAFGQKVETKSYFEGTQINGLVVDGAFEVKLKQGEKSEVKVTTSQKRFEKVSVTISENGILNLTFGSAVGMFLKSEKPLAEIVVSKLDMLTVNGNVGVIGSGVFTASEFCSIAVNGSSTVDFINVEAPKVVVLAEGAANLNEITVKAKTVEANANGASLMMIRGKCDNFVIKTFATASINAMLMEAKKITAICTGASAVKAMVNGEADVTSSGTSLFRYMGDGKVTGKAQKF